MKRYLTICFSILLMVTACGKKAVTIFSSRGVPESAAPVILPATNQALWTNGQPLYAGLDELRVRRKPDPSLSAINHLFKGDEVIYLGDKTGELYTFELQGRTITAPFVKIEMSNRTVGWVFAGGMLTMRPAITSESERKRAIASNSEQ